MRTLQFLFSITLLNGWLFLGCQNSVQQLTAMFSSIVVIDRLGCVAESLPLLCGQLNNLSLAGLYDLVFAGIVVFHRHLPLFHGHFGDFLG